MIVWAREPSREESMPFAIAVRMADETKLASTWAAMYSRTSYDVM